MRCRRLSANVARAALAAPAGMRKGDAEQPRRARSASALGAIEGRRIVQLSARHHHHERDDRALLSLCDALAQRGDEGDGVFDAIERATAFGGVARDVRQLRRRRKRSQARLCVAPIVDKVIDARAELEQRALFVGQARDVPSRQRALPSGAYFQSTVESYESPRLPK